MNAINRDLFFQIFGLGLEIKVQSGYESSPTK